MTLPSNETEETTETITPMRDRQTTDPPDDDFPTERVSLAENDDANCDAEELAMRIEIRRRMDEEKRATEKARAAANDTEPG